MARPVNKSKKRWTSSKYHIWYLEPRNGIAQTRICGKRQTTHLKWVEKTKKKQLLYLRKELKIFYILNLSKICLQRLLQNFVWGN